MISSPKAHERYDAYMKKHPDAWSNYAAWHMSEMDFPKTPWQVFQHALFFYTLTFVAAC